MDRLALRLTDRFDRWVFTAYAVPLESLAIFRILYAGYLLTVIAPQGLRRVPIPDVFFSPPLGLAALMTGPVPMEWIRVLNVALIVAAAALLLGWKTRAAAFSTGLLLIALNTCSYSFGKINHGLLLLTLLPLVLACSGWGWRYSLDARTSDDNHHDRYRGAWCLSLFALVVAVAMWTAGWPKFASGWLDPSSQAVYGKLLKNFYLNERQTWLGGQFMQWLPLYAWEVLDIFTVVMELGFLAAVWHRRAFGCFLAAACVFHLGVKLVMDIRFAGNLIAYAVFIDWSRIAVPTWFRAFRIRTAAVLRCVPSPALLLLVVAAVLVPVLLKQRSLESVSGLRIAMPMLVLGGVAGLAWLGHELYAGLQRVARLRETSKATG